jgi:polyhydroxyalkanoate synthesis regulator phasin
MIETSSSSVIICSNSTYFQHLRPKEVTMIEMIEKTFLTALGAMTLSQQKAEELLTELRQKLDVSEEEGKNFLKKVQEVTRENQQKMVELDQEEVKKACERRGLVTNEEFEKLKRKVAQLERKLKETAS